jgi:hypothetical protein
MDLIKYLNLFLHTDTPFMLLFVSLFFYNMKTNSDREKQMNNVIEEELKCVKEQMTILVKVWKILLEKELEEKKK